MFDRRQFYVSVALLAIAEVAMVVISAAAR
jgi:hypothetical protein